MALRLLTVSLLFLVSSTGFDPTSQKANTQENGDEQAVRQIEDEVTAALDHSDADALDRLWASDYIFVNPFGKILTKAQRLEMFRSGDLKLESYTRDEENIRIFGNTAVVIYRSTVKGQRGGQDIPTRRRVTTVLLKRDGRWQAISQQSTVIVER